MMSVSSSTSNETTSEFPLPAPQSPSCAPSHRTEATLTAAAGHAVQHTTSAALPTGSPIPPPPAPSSKLSHTESAGSNTDVEEIEMAPIGPDGGRHQRAHLANTATATAIPSSSRRRSPRPRDLRQGAGYDGANDSEQDSLSDEGKDPYEFSDEDLHDDEEAGLTGTDRRRKRKKRAHNTLLDQRVVRGDAITTDEIKEADKSVLRRLLINATLIGLWYLFSLSISLYNKWMFDPQKLNFPFPLFTTATHMIVQFSLSSLVLLAIPSLRPQNAVRKSNLSAGRPQEQEKPVMSMLFYLTRIGPCGAATGLDIGLGNTSLQFITLTFYTMCKSSSLAFVLIFAFLFRLEAPTWKLVAIIATMTFGVVMMVAGEVEFDLGGFILVISAAFFSGFRWALTQILLLRNPATSNPFASIFYLAPVMFVTLMLIAIPTEGIFDLWEGLGVIYEQEGLLTPLIILFPGTIAFLMTASEFALLQRTSVVTLSIAGIFKEVVTISAAAIVFGDTMTPVNIIGLLITIAAIGAYNYIKITKMRKEAVTDVHREHFAATHPDTPIETSSSSSSSSDAEGDDGEDEDGQETRGLLLRQGVEATPPKPKNNGASLVEQEEQQAINR
ncbi:putative nucleotide-sugar transporter YMD8 [Rhypophila decipiens]|uniref:Nucleotide-sugar transporter YMD8 n=1 Tax=Rhypophila decipiens TaxID=261697 RepID=A0AAN6XY29_9PEZI|nr:putative nucleotide-sugar transporter YMD8 [Rhypophila decipiens]